MNEPTLLTHKQLEPLVAAVHQREAAIITGAALPLPPFPSCPTCGLQPAELAVQQSDSFIDDSVQFAFRPCGHAFTANGEDLYDAYNVARHGTAHAIPDPPLGGKP